MTRRATFLAAALVAVGRPTWWLMALATFLLRGGIVVVVLPIVTLPSVLGLSNAFAPILIPLALGRIDPVVLVGPILLVGVLLLWLILGGRLAAGIDVALVAEESDAAIDEGVAGAVPVERARSGSEVGWGVFALRLVAWLPLALALGVAIARIVEVTYVELTRPVDVVTPLIVRVATETVSHLGLVVVAWTVGEVVGGVATRNVTLTASGHGRALGWAIRTSAASPFSWLVPWVVATAILVLVMGLTLAASAFAWARAVDVLADRFTNPFLALLTMLVFVALWFAAMLLGGAILATRSATQTFEHVRRQALARAAGMSAKPPPDPDGAGTFGASSHRRPGDWSADDGGGSL